jgi:aminocarboxymuconate-semialdehyde decarboxylase
MIDLHTHILPTHLPDVDAQLGYPGWVHLRHGDDGTAEMIQGGNLFRVVERSCWDAEARLEECDRFGVEVQVLSTVPVLFGYWAPADDALSMARRLNDDIAATVARWPSRFVGLGTVPMQHVDHAILELRRCIGDLGMPGLQIGSHINEQNLDDDALEPFWEAANDLEAAILVHPWDMMGRETMQRHWMPWLVSMPAESARAMVSLMMGGVIERYPQIRFLFVHGGGAFAGTVGRIDHGFRVRPDLCQTRTTTLPSVLARRVWVDTAVHDPRALHGLLDVFDPQRIGLGTDYPFPLGEHRPGEVVEAASLDSTLQRSLLHDAPLRWLGARTARALGRELP